jgi:hypothetical protein
MLARPLICDFARLVADKTDGFRVRGLERGLAVEDVLVCNPASKAALRLSPTPPEFGEMVKVSPARAPSC